MSRSAGWLLVSVAALWLFPHASGALAWICYAALPIGLLLALRNPAVAIARHFGRSWSFGFLNSVALVLGSSTIAIVAFELVLGHWASRPPEESAPVMPREWEARDVQVPGAHSAYYWQGKLHIESEEGFRIIGDWPAKRKEVFRIMAIGDSFTYGQGIAEEDTYSRVLERRLSEKYRVEVLNLGRQGFQSPDILRTLRSKLDRLNPDLVIYGMCLNDFLPSKTREYRDRPWDLSFPGKQQLLKNTRVAPFIAGKMDAVLMRFGIRLDFFGDILRDFHGYQTRFAADVKAMNDLVVTSGRPPIVGMVVDIWPDEPRSGSIVEIAERHMRSAAMTVVPADYRRRKGLNEWEVSRWESHPNEVANRVFAEALLPAVETTPRLESFQKNLVAPAAYEGFHDGATCQTISGWAWDRNQPDRPIEVDLFDGKTWIATLLADQPRADLVKAGKGDGHHSFAFDTPGWLRDGRSHAITVRYHPGGAVVDAGPRTITCPTQ